MTNHVITKDYQQLKGFSTDSIFKRPAFVSDICVNVNRLPDGTFAPRRGYQFEAAGVGGLGNSIYENHIDHSVQAICINVDGNLYKKHKATIDIAFTGTDRHEYVAYEIFVDPLVSSDNQTYRFDPYSNIAQTAQITDSINFKMGKVTAYNGISIGTGSATYSGVLPGAPLAPGSIEMKDGALIIYDNPSGSDTGDGTFSGDVGVGVNTINYTTGAYTVTFSGVTGSVIGNYRSALITQFNVAMGKGYGVSSPYSITSLVGMLNSVTGVVATPSGQTNYPGAFIEVCDITIIPDKKTAVLTYYYWLSVNRTLAVTFPGLVASLVTDAYRNATFAAYQQVIYIANPFDPVQKYDGQTVYNAGMPNGAMPSAAAGTTGNVDTGDHTYYITYEQIDASGRLVEGVISDGYTITLITDSIVEVTVNNLIQGTGWNTNCAIIAFPQLTANTIIVETGHTMQVGDSAFLLDTSGNPHTRLVTAVTSMSITIDGAPINVTNATDWQKAISNNLKINIYRTKALGLEPFFVFSIPNNSYQATTTYEDNVADADLNQQYIFPSNRHDPPPTVGVVFPFNNLVIYTADPNNDDFVWYSDPDQPEYVDQLQSPINEPNRFLVPSNSDDIVGVGVAGSTLVIFKNLSIYAISGEIATEQYTLIAVAQGSNIGCVAHATIKSVGELLYFLHTNGIYSMSETSIFPTDEFGNPIALTIPIDKFFRDNTGAGEVNQQYVLSRAVATNYTKDNQYILFLPCETPCGCPINIAPRVANDNSRILCYDYQGKNWFEWTNINAAGGIYVNDDNLYWQERRASQTGKAVSKSAKQHRQYLLIDQADHVVPVRTTWISSWEDYSQPRVRKKFVRAALLFDNISSRFQTNLPRMFFFTSIDWNTGTVDTQSIITTEVNARPWSISDWSWTTWSGYQDTFVVIPLKNGTVTKSIQVGLQLNQLNTSFNLQGFQLEISPDFRRVIAR